MNDRHTSEDIETIRELPAGSGGKCLIVAGSTKPFYAGLRRPPADTLLEALLTLIVTPVYEEILVFSAAGSHLPNRPLSPDFTVGQLQGLWWLRGGKPLQEQTSEPVQAGFASFDEPPPSSCRFDAMHNSTWTERMLKVFGVIEAETGVDWLSGASHGEVGPKASPVRKLILIDDAFLSPHTPALVNPYAEARGFPRGNERNTWGARFAGLPQICRGKTVDVVIYCRNVTMAQSLVEGDFIVKDILSHLTAEQSKQDIQSIANHFPPIRWSETFVAVLPPLSAEQPNGIYFPNQSNSRFYETLRLQPPQSPPSALRELQDKMIGMEHVIEQLEPIEFYAKECRQREREGLPVHDLNLNTLLYGSPGTGKTTLAKIIGNIYANCGILRGNKFTAVTRADLVGNYIGDTAMKTRKVCEQSLGGTLFIDEAYDLAQGGDRDFGKEAAGELLVWMLKCPRDLAVVAAGYPDQMPRFLGLNAGLPGRFSRKITLPDYDTPTLIRIIFKIAESGGYTIQPGASAVIARRLEDYKAKCATVKQPFRFAGDADQLCKSAITQASMRRRKSGARGLTQELLAADFENAQLGIV